jgi:hypothetical protein
MVPCVHGLYTRRQGLKVIIEVGDKNVYEGLHTNGSLVSGELHVIWQYFMLLQWIRLRTDKQEVGMPLPVDSNILLEACNKGLRRLCSKPCVHGCD